jgi:SAM-dependent methyltransferase
MGPQEMQARLGERWAAIHRIQGRYQLEQEERVLRAAAERWAPRGIRSIADIGCGDGRRAAELTRLFPGATVTAFEVRADLAGEARANCAGTPVEVVTADFCEAPPLPAGGFDLLHVRFALHLLDPERRERFLASMARASHAGTIAFVEDHDSRFHVVYPPCPFLSRMIEVSARLSGRERLDVEIGRKLPSLLARHGFSDFRVDVACLDNTRMAPADFRELMSAQAEVLAAFMPEEVSEDELRRGLAELADWAASPGALTLGAAIVVTCRREMAR